MVFTQIGDENYKYLKRKRIVKIKYEPDQFDVDTLNLYATAFESMFPIYNESNPRANRTMITCLLLQPGDKTWFVARVKLWYENKGRVKIMTVYYDDPKTKTDFFLVNDDEENEKYNELLILPINDTTMSILFGDVKSSAVIPVVGSKISERPDPELVYDPESVRDPELALSEDQLDIVRKLMGERNEKYIKIKLLLKGRRQRNGGLSVTREQGDKLVRKTDGTLVDPFKDDPKFNGIKWNRFESIIKKL